jgi:hypothetical protein
VEVAAGEGLAQVVAERAVVVGAAEQAAATRAVAPKAAAVKAVVM